MTHWPAFMVASSKLRSCFSEYLTPMSTPLCSPFVLAWRGGCWEYQGGAAGTLNPLGIALRLTPGPPAAPPSHRRAQLRTGVLTSHPLPPSITSRYPTLQRPTCSPRPRPRPSPLPGPPASTPQGPPENTIDRQFPPPEMLSQPSLITGPTHGSDSPFLRLLLTVYN